MICSHLYNFDKIECFFLIYKILLKIEYIIVIYCINEMELFPWAKITWRRVRPSDRVENSVDNLNRKPLLIKSNGSMWCYVGDPRESPFVQ